MTHLNQDQIIQYIHRTLTDAERETMDRHLADCPLCRARLDDHEGLQRRIRYGLQADLRVARPSSRLKFTHIAGRVKRSRRWWLFVRGSNQLLNAAVTLALVAAFGFGLFGLYQVFSAPGVAFPKEVRQAMPVPVTAVPPPVPTPTAAGAVVSPREALVGTWERAKPGYPQPGRYVWRINPDGTDLMLEEQIVGGKVVGNEGYCCFSSDGTWRVEGTQLQLEAVGLVRDSTDLWGCNSIGRYRIQRLAEGRIKLVVISEDCGERREIISGGEWRKVTPLLH